MIVDEYYHRRFPHLVACVSGNGNSIKQHRSFAHPGDDDWDQAAVSADEKARIEADLQAKHTIRYDIETATPQAFEVMAPISGFLGSDTAPDVAHGCSFAEMMFLGTQTNYITHHMEQRWQNSGLSDDLDPDRIFVTGCEDIDDGAGHTYGMTLELDIDHMAALVEVLGATIILSATGQRLKLPERPASDGEYYINFDITLLDTGDVNYRVRLSGDTHRLSEIRLRRMEAGQGFEYFMTDLLNEGVQ